MFRFTLICLISFYAVQSEAAEQVISGKVTHVGSNTIDKNAKVEVELRDVSLMDVASKLIASTTISDAKTFPISYKIKYNPSDIRRGNTYTISAKIKGSDDQLLFINDVRTTVDLTGSPSRVVDVAVIRVGGSADTEKATDKKICPPVNCRGKPKVCPYGYQKKDGCEICKCNDPCNPSGKPILCGPNQRCFIDKKPDGTFGTRCGSPKEKNKVNKPNLIKLKAECKSPRLIGLCRSNLPRFYYNSATNTCEQFSYGGCKGSKNNFASKAECEMTCKA